MSDNEFGAFLRTRRDALTPREVGLPNGARRRTPGLRRAELATLAGVSVEYLTRLEQGRDRHPSPQVLTALADALRLSPDDRALFHRIAKATNGAACAIAHPAGSLVVRPTVRALLDQMEPAPAVVLSQLGDLLAWNSGYAQLAAPHGMVAHGLLPAAAGEVTGPETTPVNLIRYVFLDYRARAAYPDWDSVADDQVARLRTRAAFADPAATALAEELTTRAGTPFTQRYRAPARLPTNTGIELWRHPDLGELRLVYETLALAGIEDQQLVVYLAADDTTAAALEKLTSN